MEIDNLTIETVRQKNSLYVAFAYFFFFDSLYVFVSVKLNLFIVQAEN